MKIETYKLYKKLASYITGKIDSLESSVVKKSNTTGLLRNEGSLYTGYFSGRESVTFTTSDISSLSQWMLYINWGSPMKYMSIMYQISNNAPITHIL